MPHLCFTMGPRFRENKQRQVSAPPAETAETIGSDCEDSARFSANLEGRGSEFIGVHVGRVASCHEVRTVRGTMRARSSASRSNQRVCVGEIGPGGYSLDGIILGSHCRELSTSIGNWHSVIANCASAHQLPGREPILCLEHPAEVGRIIKAPAEGDDASIRCGGELRATKPPL